ncbi:MAG: hypothetical protein WBP45_02660 [Daejeonella sp.]
MSVRRNIMGHKDNYFVLFKIVLTFSLFVFIQSGFCQKIETINEFLSDYVWKNADGITLIAKMQESKNQQPGLNIIPFEFVDFEVNDPCTFDKISKAHQEFIKSSYFKTDDPILSKVREVGYISYKTLFAHLECATSEEIALKLYPDTLSVTHKALQSTYGFTNGLVSNFDLLAAIEGTKELGKGVLEMNSDTYLSYTKDMVGLLANPPNISDFQEPEKLKKLFTKLSPPTLRNDLQALDKGVNVVNGLWKFYATQGNYWRSGQLAATVIPIVLTGGEFAATKIKGWIKGTDKAASLLKTAKKLEQTAGNTVNIIDETGNVKTITLEGDELVVRAGDELATLFAGARQRAIAKFGKEAEDLIYIKFNKDGGAVAEILDHYGVEGLNVLKKVNKIDDVANELIKGKMAYRHVSSNVLYLDQMKQSGKLPAQTGNGTTYFSLDKFDNPIVAIDKMQLNSKGTDAAWRVEFDATQLINKAQIPKGKWNNAEYIEVLTRSYPNFGSGGASQFFTQSEIQIKRLVNLKTGEVINFK